MGNTIATLNSDIDRIGGIQTGRYSSANKMRSMTIGARTINQEISKVIRDYDYQAECSIHNLVANQREYLNPSDFFKIKRLDLKLDGTNWKRANFTDESNIGNEYNAEADIIQHFSNSDPFVSLFDESYFIWSGTITAVTGGIRITYAKDLVGKDTDGNDIQDFSATSDVPNLIEFAQQALVYWGIIDWYLEHTNKDKLKQFNKLLWGSEEGRPSDDRLIGGLMRQILDYYSDRAPDKQMNLQSSYQEENFE